jgi:hypothetical protein
MTLTKHLYRFEEVRAAFLYTLKQGRLEEAFFWLAELECSCYGGEARRLLFVSWMMRVGIQRLAWLNEWALCSKTPEGRRQLCKQLIQCKERDSSIWLLVWSVALTESTLPEAPGYLFTQWLTTCTKEDEEFWQPIVDTSTDERIDTIFSELQDTMKQYSIFAKATATTIVFSKGIIDTASWRPCAPYQDIIPDEKEKGRKYAIPYDCLYGMTIRGAGFNTIEELQSLGQEQFQRSPFWKHVWPMNPNDDQLEQFWDTYFPWVEKDHPDEWSKEEQLKSHGPGVPVGPFYRWWLNWIENDHLFIWGTVYTRILKWVKSHQTDSKPVIEKVIEFYKGFNYTGSIPKYPMQKIFILT